MGEGQREGDRLWLHEQIRTAFKTEVLLRFQGSSETISRTATGTISNLTVVAFGTSLGRIFVGYIVQGRAPVILPVSTDPSSFAAEIFDIGVLGKAQGPGTSSLVDLALSPDLRACVALFPDNRAVVFSTYTLCPSAFPSSPYTPGSMASAAAAAFAPADVACYCASTPGEAHDGRALGTFWISNHIIGFVFKNALVTCTARKMSLVHRSRLSVTVAAPRASSCQQSALVVCHPRQPIRNEETVALYLNTVSNGVIRALYRFNGFPLGPALDNTLLSSTEFETDSQDAFTRSLCVVDGKVAMFSLSHESMASLHSEPCGLGGGPVHIRCGVCCSPTATERCSAGFCGQKFGYLLHGDVLDVSVLEEHVSECEMDVLPQPPSLPPPRSDSQSFVLSPVAAGKMVKVPLPEAAKPVTSVQLPLRSPVFVPPTGGEEPRILVFTSTRALALVYVPTAQEHKELVRRALCGVTHEYEIETSRQFYNQIGVPSCSTFEEVVGSVIETVPTCAQTLLLPHAVPAPSRIAMRMLRRGIAPLRVADLLAQSRSDDAPLLRAVALIQHALLTQDRGPLAGVLGDLDESPPVLLELLARAGLSDELFTLAFRSGAAETDFPAALDAWMLARSLPPGSDDKMARKFAVFDRLSVHPRFTRDLVTPLPSSVIERIVTPMHIEILFSAQYVPILAALPYQSIITLLTRHPSLLLSNITLCRALLLVAPPLCSTMVLSVLEGRPRPEVLRCGAAPLMAECIARSAPCAPEPGFSVAVQKLRELEGLSAALRVGRLDLAVELSSGQARAAVLKLKWRECTAAEAVSDVVKYGNGDTSLLLGHLFVVSEIWSISDLEKALSSSNTVMRALRAFVEDCVSIRFDEMEWSSEFLLQVVN